MMFKSSLIFRWSSQPLQLVRRTTISKLSSFNSNVYLGSTNQTGQSLDEYLKTFNLVTHIVEPWARRQPDHPALMLTDGSTTDVISYSQLLNQSDYLASSLAESEKRPPKCAIVILPKVTPWWVINIAGSLCDMIISPGTSMLAPKEILFRLKMCEADTIFCDIDVMNKIHEMTGQISWRILVGETQEEEENNMREGWISYHKLLSLGSKLKPIRKVFNGDSIAQLFFTSGTTGNPKMVPHTQAGFGIGHETTSRDWLGLTSKDLLWNISDLGWAKAAYSSLYAPLIAGCTIFAHKMSRFDSQVVLRTLEEMPVSVLCFPPTALRAIVQEDLVTFRPKALRKCVSAGEPLNPEVADIWYETTGLRVQEGYGQTESTLVCSSFEGLKVKPGTIGKPAHGFDIKIIDENFNELGPNMEGQIVYDLRNGWPYGLFKGYLNNPEQNKKVFVNGYYLTGDKAYFDKDGYICYVGRDDDIIISAGYRIGPFEVESALIEHPAVIESAAVASPDEQRGHVVKAFIVLNDKMKEKITTEEERLNFVKEIQDFVKNTITPYKYPRKIEFVDSLPKTISGKIRRIELREKEIKQPPPPQKQTEPHQPFYYRH